MIKELEEIYDEDLLELAKEEELYEHTIFDFLDEDDEILCDRSRWELKSNEECIKAIDKKSK